MLALSLALHAPFTPVVGVLGLLRWLSPSDDDSPLVPPTEIPVELMADLIGPSAAGEPTRPADPAPKGDDPGEPTEVATKPPPKPRPAKVPVLDAGSPDAGIPDAGAPDAAISDAGPSDAGPLDAAPPDAGPVALGDAGPDAGARMAEPVALAGAARRLVSANTNVSLLIDAEKLRGHPLGRQVGSILSGIYQWRDFFGPTGIDPVRDIDRILVTGPQFRKSADVIAVIQHRLGGERMRSALGRLVEHDTEQGQWLDAGVPIARATADRAARYFVVLSPKVVVVTPESGLKSAEKLAEGQQKKGRRAPFSIPALPGAVIATASVATPWRAFKPFRVRIPETIRHVRASVEPRADGGAILRIDADDESPEAAVRDAEEIQRLASSATRVDLGFFGRALGVGKIEFVESVSFRANGSSIIGEVTLSASQVVDVMGQIRVRLVPQPPGASSVAPTVTPPP